MHTTSKVDLGEIHRVLFEVVDQVPSGFACLLLPTALLYISIYARVYRLSAISNTFTFASIGTFIACPYLAPVHCGPIRCIQNTAGPPHSLVNPM